jgi:iron complex outermembrane receptor protein
MANQTLQAKLRGLSPNHTLVLVNGKRRHTTASLAILGGPYQGGAGVTSISYRWIASITSRCSRKVRRRIRHRRHRGGHQHHHEESPQGGSVSVTNGAHYSGDGNTSAISANMGFEATELVHQSRRGVPRSRAHQSRRHRSASGGPARIDPDEAAHSPTRTCPSRRGIHSSTRSLETPRTKSKWSRSMRACDRR